MNRRRLTYANVASTLALALAVSGVAYAAGLAPHSVGTRHLKSGAVTTPKLARDSVTSKKVDNFALRLRDLGGIANRETSALSSTLNVPGGGCINRQMTGFNPAPKGLIGSLVVGYLTDDQGDAVLDNFGVVVPTVVSETSQGGAIVHLVVCDGGSGQTVPAGSVFHYGLIGP